MAAVFIGIGSSINRSENIRLGIAALQTEFGELLLSPLYESEAVGFSGVNFYNLVVKLHTDHDIVLLIKKLKSIEKQHGRPDKTSKFTPRTLDLDLLLYDQQIDPSLDLPRGEILKNAFVLKPLSELAPTLRHPILGETYQALWANYPQEKQKLWKV
jgi:2-amino-4-hydroxy-6-hydroxymethyldihydropteridine diphosphokinase